MSSNNNGGSTDYYKINRKWKDAMDIVEARNMNYSQGNIFKVAFTFNIGRHSGTDYERELNKIVYFAERELARIKLLNIKCEKPAYQKHHRSPDDDTICVCGKSLLLTGSCPEVSGVEQHGMSLVHKHLCICGSKLNDDGICVELDD